MRTFYHISRSTSRQSILKHGLLPKSKRGYTLDWPGGAIKRKGYRNKIFLFRDKDKASYGYVSHNGAMDLWEVKVPDDVRVKQDPFVVQENWTDTNCCMVGKAIPPENLKLISVKWHPLEYEGSLDDPLDEEDLIPGSSSGQ